MPDVDIGTVIDSTDYKRLALDRLEHTLLYMEVLSRIQMYLEDDKLPPLNLVKLAAEGRPKEALNWL